MCRITSRAASESRELSRVESNQQGSPQSSSGSRASHMSSSASRAFTCIEHAVLAELAESYIKADLRSSFFPVATLFLCSSPSHRIASPRSDHRVRRFNRVRVCVCPPNSSLIFATKASCSNSFPSKPTSLTLNCSQVVLISVTPFLASFKLRMLPVSISLFLSNVSRNYLKCNRLADLIGSLQFVLRMAALSSTTPL